jgi:sulfatase modifying factor 1
MKKNNVFLVLWSLCVCQFPIFVQVPVWLGSADSDITAENKNIIDDHLSKEKSNCNNIFVDTTFGLNLEMVAVKGGTFKMGSNEKNDEEPVHSVTLSDFYLGKYEITLGQFRKFIEETGFETYADKNGGSYFFTGSEWKLIAGLNWKYNAAGTLSKGEENHPVKYVCWYDAVKFCEWLSQKSGKTYRLPTEAEWEYAARGGDRASDAAPTKYAGSNTIDKIAWYGSNSYNNTHPVGTKLPNQLGIYDLTGNVWELCSDWYCADYYSKSPLNNPKGAPAGIDVVRRGASWFQDSDTTVCRITTRGSIVPFGRSMDIGFRVACSSDKKY